jgi:hypothetical protein
MNSFHCFVQARGGKRRFRPWRGALLLVVLLAGCLGLGRTALAQTAPAADAGGARLSVGGTASAFDLGYGQVKILGASAFVDADTLRHFGFEGEARWLQFHVAPWNKGPAAAENASTYMIGARYSRYYGRFQPYAKGIVGFGMFNYPYNLGSETDLVVAPGGGFDYRLTRRIRLRAVDFEYQMWPQFHYGMMSTFGLSTGIKVKIF